MRLIALVCAVLLCVAPARAADDIADLRRALVLLEKRDHAEALKIITPKADAGDPVAQYYLSAIYSGGFGYKPANDALSLKWIRLSAEQGVAAAQATLADRYYDGRGVKQDFAEAAKWYHLSADQGFAQAQRTLGELYEIGKGVAPDAGKAFGFYQMAAEQGLAVAQVSVGRMYALGAGTVQDHTSAVNYFRMAANQKSSAAAIWLGSAYETGSGIEKDLVMAYMWSTLAAEFGKARDTVAEPASGMGVILEHLRYNMTMDQVAKAEQMVKDWKPEPNSP